MVTRAFCGLAISPTAVASALPNGGESWRRTLAPAAADGGWPSLATALREGVASGAIVSPVRIALLPPLAEVRTVSIPPVGDEDARRLLTRAATRHFLSAREPVEVGVAPAAAGGPRLAAAVAMRTLRAVLDAARECSLDVDLVVPAQAALARGATASPRASSVLLVEFDEHSEMLVARNGVPVDLRRFRRSGDEHAIADATRALGTPVRIVDPLVASAVALCIHGDAPIGMAFGGAQVTVGQSPKAYRRSWWTFGAAAALAMGTVALQEVDVRRELAAVRAERAALAPRLRPASSAGSGRDEQLSALSAPRWSRVVAAIGDALPPDASVTNLRAHADTVVVEGIATRATAAFDALASASWVQRIVASAPIRRDVSDDGTVTEKFEFTITMAGR